MLLYFLYNILFFIFAILYFPIYFIRGKVHRDILMRFGFLPAGFCDYTKGAKIIWLHAVSVGEIAAAAKLISSLKESFSEYKLVISTVTPSGNMMAKHIGGESCFVIYLPLDLSFIVNKVVDKINPKIFIILETEIWPSIFCALSKRKIPIVLVNGRISDSSFKRYLPLKPLLKGVLGKAAVLCMQTDKDKSKILEMGAPFEKVIVTGNMKYDIEKSAVVDAVVSRIKKFLTDGAKVFVAGSTHPGEEEALLSAYKKLRLKFTALKFIIAPRHIDRLGRIKKMITDSGLNPLLLSEIENGAELKDEIIIVDKFGILNSLYSLADAVFVGGSLIPHGGQNPVEPAMESKPVIFGPFMSNFEDAKEALLSSKGAIQVADEKGLALEIDYLLGSPDESHAMGARAKEAVEKKRGATARNIEVVRNLLCAAQTTYRRDI